MNKVCKRIYIMNFDAMSDISPLSDRYTMQSEEDLSYATRENSVYIGVYRFLKKYKVDKD